MEQELPYEIRFAGREEWEEAMGLAWKTFLEFEALRILSQIQG